MGDYEDYEDWGIKKAKRWQGDDPESPQRGIKRPKDVTAIGIMMKAISGRARAPLNLISGAEHDQIWFALETHEIDEISDEDVKALRGCGVFYDPGADRLSMYV